MKKILILVGIIILLASCNLPEVQRYEESQQFKEGKTQALLITADVVRIYDREADVFCWIYSDARFTLNSAYGKGGISCLPVNDTRLKRPE